MGAGQLIQTQVALRVRGALKPGSSVPWHLLTPMEWIFSTSVQGRRLSPARPLSAALLKSYLYRVRIY